MTRPNSLDELVSHFNDKARTLREEAAGLLREAHAWEGAAGLLDSTLRRSRGEPIRLPRVRVDEED